MDGPLSQFYKHRFFAFNRYVKALSITIIITLLFIASTGLALAEGENNDNSGTGWILFYITLVILIVIIILWIVTYVIMRGVIKRLESERDKVVRYEKRKEKDEERLDHEHAREGRRRARAPKGNCLVCNRKFIPGADAYQCDCGKFIHVQCLAEMSLCPHCGREIDKDYGVVRVEDSGSGARGGRVSRTKINRLIKAKFCPVCNKIIKAGDSGMQCDRCEAVMHNKCSDKARTCPKCGN
jgi:ribosomal protein L33